MTTIYHFPVVQWAVKTKLIPNFCGLAGDEEMKWNANLQQKKGKIFQRAKKSLTVWPVVKIFSLIHQLQ